MNVNDLYGRHHKATLEWLKDKTHEKWCKVLAIREEGYDLELHLFDNTYCHACTFKFKSSDYKLVMVSSVGIPSICMKPKCPKCGKHSTLQTLD